MTTTTTEHPKVRQIHLLQRKAQDPSVTEQERDAINEKIAELAAKYGIDMLRQTISDETLDEMVIKDFEINLDYADAHARLLYRVLDALGCQAVICHREGEADLTTIGYLNDIERAELLYTSLSLQMASAVERFCGGLGIRRTRSYLYGFADGAGEVLMAAEMAAQNNANAADVAAGRPGVALVLADRKTQVDRAFRQEYPSVGKSRNRVTDAGAYMSGQAAGRKANLGTGAGNVCQTSRTALS